MRGIAKLLFGDGADGPFDLFGWDEGGAPGAAERVLQSREWCGTTPGRGSAEGAVRGAAQRGRGARGVRRQVVIRKTWPR